MKITHLIFVLLFIAALSFVGYAVAYLPFKTSIVLLIGFIFSILTIINLEIGLFLLIFVIPFTQQVTLGKLGGFAPVHIGTDDVLIIFILLSWLANLAKRKDFSFIKTSLNWPIFSFFTIAVFSFIGADARFGQGAILVCFLHLFKFFEYVAIYFVVISAINNLDQVKKFIWMFFIVVGFVVLLHLVIFFRLGFLNVSGPVVQGFEMDYFIKTMHTFESNAILGVYYSFFLSILLVIILNTSISEGKAPLLLFAFFIAIALFNTFSRAAYLSIVGSFCIIAFFQERKFFLIILLLIIFSPIYMQSAVLERITLTIQNSSLGIVLDPSAAIRLVIWEKGLKIFLDNPILGQGYWITRWLLHTEAHSQYMAILIEMGVIGFSIFCWLVVRMFTNAVDLMKKANTVFLKSLSLGYIAGFTSILVTCFFSESLESFRMIGPLWFITGLISSANRLLSEKTQILEGQK
ncbi:MAG: O-antigen ligase family protein [Candidatus Omnitrophota bacterium]